jgi:hypothetical protein
MVSLLYLLFRRALAVASLRVRSREFKELEIVVLRHELAVLRRTKNERVPRPVAGRPQQGRRGQADPTVDERSGGEVEGRRLFALSSFTFRKDRQRSAPARRRCRGPSLQLHSPRANLWRRSHFPVMAVIKDSAVWGSRIRKLIAAEGLTDCVSEGSGPIGQALPRDGEGNRVIGVFAGIGLSAVLAVLFARFERRR